jgi:integrase
MAGRSARLGKKTVDALKPEAREYTVWDTTIRGFGVRVYPSERKVYLLKYRANGGRSGTIRKPTIGTHGEITCDEAREIAGDWKAEVRRGRDPSGEKQAKRQAPTLTQFWERYEADVLGHKGQRSADEDRRNWRLHIKPRLGSMKVYAIQQTDISRALAPLRNRPGAFNRTRALLSHMLTVAEAPDWRLRPPHSNPVRYVKREPEHHRQRFLSHDELYCLAQVLDESNEDPSAIVAIKLLILTGCRRNEILTLEWRDIDLARGILNLPRSKTGQKIVYLPAPAREVLAGVERVKGNPYVLTGRKPKSHLVGLNHIWQRVRSKATVRLWEHHSDPEISVLVKALRGRLERQPTVKECGLAARKASLDLHNGLEDVRLHDLRHSFASFGMSAGFSVPILGKLLGHTQTRTTERYAHLGEDPARLAVERIGAEIAAAMEGQEAEIVDLEKRRK